MAVTIPSEALRGRVVVQVAAAGNGKSTSRFRLNVRICEAFVGEWAANATKCAKDKDIKGRLTADERIAR